MKSSKNKMIINKGNVGNNIIVKMRIGPLMEMLPKPLMVM